MWSCTKFQKVYQFCQYSFMIRLKFCKFLDRAHVLILVPHTSGTVQHLATSLNFSIMEIKILYIVLFLHNLFIIKIRKFSKILFFGCLTDMAIKVINRPLHPSECSLECNTTCWLTNKALQWFCCSASTVNAAASHSSEHSEGCKGLLITFMAIAVRQPKTRFLRTFLF